jgi:hyperosmotically inducible periplasmic protein
MRQDHSPKQLGLTLMTAVMLLAACAPIQGQETAGQYVDDATISTKVRAELVKNQALKAFDIHVDTMKDVVQLSGFVDSPEQKAQAGQIAAGVSGVRGVENNIIVQSK